MWFRFWRPDYFYLRHSKLLGASDGSPFNRGWSQGFGLFVLDCRWNERRSESSDGIHYPALKRTIVVNGKPHAWDSPYISYEEVIALADERPGASVIYTNAARFADEQTSGTLYHGKAPIIVKDGTEFDAVMTGNA